jgi:hypothetical protein
MPHGLLRSPNRLHLLPGNKSERTTLIPAAVKLPEVVASVCMEKEMICIYESVNLLRSDFSRKAIRFIGSRSGEGWRLLSGSTPS